MNKDYYHTSDLGLSAALLTYGIELVGIEKDNPRRVVFKFAEQQNLGVIIESYWNGDLSVCALKHFGNIKLLKSRIYGS